MAKDNCSISLRLDTDTRDLLFKHAEEEDLSVSQVVRRAIREYIKENIDVEEEGGNTNG
jgi:uncharacterized protein (DUF1778 family)